MTFQAIANEAATIISKPPVIIVGVLAWVSGWFYAFTASLPNPDDPSDWPSNVYPYGVKYRVLYKTLRMHNNQKPQPIAVPPARPQEMLPPK